MGSGFVITFTVVGLGVAWRARRRGHLLLDTGLLEQPVLTRNLADYLPLALLLVGTWLWSMRVGPEPLVILALALAGILAVVVVMKKRIHLRFTDQGICLFELIKWSEIRSYRWNRKPEGGEELELYVSRRGWDSTICYPIPAMHREGVAEILAAQVPSGS
jgi:hypothetical protein